MNQKKVNNFTCSTSTLSNEDLMKRIENKHGQQPLTTYFKEVIFGGVDGIITTFAVVAGFTGAALSTETTTQLSFAVVLLFGLANLFADAVSMGLGNFLSVLSDKDLFTASRKKKLIEIRDNPQIEFDETVFILTEKGFSEEDACSLAHIYKRNESYWTDFMMHYALEMSDPKVDNPVYTGLSTFLSFAFFGAIPLIPFLIVGRESSADPKTVFLYSVLGTFIALMLLGIMKWKVVGTKLRSTLIEVFLVGGTAAIVAYYVGTFFAG